jgi:glycine betaine/proline transport system substrate-binding protein
MVKFRNCVINVAFESIWEDMMKSVIFGLAVAGSAFLFSAGAQAADDCGEITIAEMNWASAEFIANLDKVVLEEGFGCSVELIPGATMTTFASMESKGEPMVAPELWANAVQTPLKKAVEEGRMAVLNMAPITGAGEGWMISSSVAKANNLKTVSDVLARPDLFPHPEDAKKGGIVTCPSGWGCQIATGQLFKAFGMEDKGWQMVDPGSSAGLDGSIEKAATRQEAWFGYYWGPTVLASKAGLTLLDMGEFAGNDNWDNCIMVPECADPKPTGWVTSVVTTTVASDFFKNGPEASKGYMEKRQFPADVMNKMLVWMNSNQASGEDAAYEFLAKYPQVWNSWVPADVAAKIKAAL